MGSDLDDAQPLVANEISIHAPRVGSDVIAFGWLLHCVEFQSTLPAWGATPLARQVAMIQLISIHAPRVGSDVIVYRMIVRFVDFNPRSPRGERPCPYTVGRGG